MLKIDSDEYKKVQETFLQIKLSLSELSNLDLSNLHVHNDWSMIPYVQEHLYFFVEQISGLSENLKDSPPPKPSEEVKSIVGSMPESLP